MPTGWTRLDRAIFALCALVLAPVAVVNLLVGNWAVGCLLATQAVVHVIQRTALRTTYRWGYFDGQRLLWERLRREKRLP